MPTKDEVFQAQIAAARTYENPFVAGLFQKWALRVIDVAQIQLDRCVLDVGCGTEADIVTGVNPH